jgi:TonB family protein
MRFSLAALIFAATVCSAPTAHEPATRAPRASVKTDKRLPGPGRDRPELLSKCHDQPRVVSGSNLAPLILKRVAPDMQQCSRREIGFALVELTVSSAGKVSSARMRRSASPCWDKAILAALRQWEFCPGERNGKPADVTTVVSVSPELR